MVETSFRTFAAVMLSVSLWGGDPLGVMKGERGTCPTPDASVPLTLSGVVAQALCANPQTSSSWAAVRYQSALLGVADAAYLPGVTVGGSLAADHDTGGMAGTQNYGKGSAGAAVSYLLYDFGGRDAAREEAAAALLSSSDSYDAVVQSVFLAAVRAYYDLFAAQASLEACQSAELSAQESLAAATARVDAGVAIPADRLQAQAAYAKAMLNRVAAEGGLTVARGKLAAAMGMDAQMPVTVQAPEGTNGTVLPAASLEVLIARAKQDRPDLAAARADIRAAEASVKAARAAGMPALSLTSSVTGGDTSVASPTSNASVAVAVSFPLFTGYATTYKIAAARELQHQKEALALTLERQVSLDVYSAYSEVVTADRKARLTDDLVASSRAAYTTALGRYKAGVGTILDVLSAQAAQADADQQKISAVYVLAVSKVALAKALGNGAMMNDELTKGAGR